jgi:hypothetical protein
VKEKLVQRVKVKNKEKQKKGEHPPKNQMGRINNPRKNMGKFNDFSRKQAKVVKKNCFESALNQESVKQQFRIWTDGNIENNG